MATTDAGERKTPLLIGHLRPLYHKGNSYKRADWHFNPPPDLGYCRDEGGAAMYTLPAPVFEVLIDDVVVEYERVPCRHCHAAD
jgi:hypothetical protein